jgi:hypothetical protein
MPSLQFLLGGRDTGPKRIIIPFQQVDGKRSVDLPLSAKTKRPNIRHSCQLVEQRLGVLEVGGIEALGEPPVYRAE